MRCSNTIFWSIFCSHIKGRYPGNPFRRILVYLGSFRLIWAHLVLLELIKAHLSSFKLIQAQIGPHSEDAYFYVERELSLINRKALRGELGGAAFFLDWSFEHQFISSSRTLSETIGQWDLLMWGVGALSGAVITGKTTKLKIRVPM